MTSYVDEDPQLEFHNNIQICAVYYGSEKESEVEK
jgi:hypothetical protein